ncbi:MULTISPECIES: DUF3618 domain-containing protein [Streptosporangium]|uniref:DUF3618 domain-containing protein n=1 Tax=Streptosporangium brasiliense TaxID=47480 RepID=A0ABT9RCM9_9ACTN|nr:DUF3618 domain-containing protein [Streptosporangium brasiliense]MDP9867013.1 hypothetical protein [Streptosporangium brasiliense]
MTETDPGRPGRDVEEAGITGSRRKEVGEPVTPDESGSLNIPPNAPEMSEVPPPGRDGRPTEDLGLPPSERDGTPRPVDRTGPGPAEPDRTDAGRADAGTAVAGGTRDDRAEVGTAVAGGTRDDRAGADRTSAGKPSKESVRRDIERDRRELGDTVEALVHKTDVKARVQETATHVGEDLRRMGAATAGTATEMVGRVKEAAPEMVGRVKEAAPEMVGRVKEMTPVELKDAAGKVTTEAGKRPVMTVAAVAALALVAFRVLRRGRRGKR